MHSHGKPCPLCGFLFGLGIFVLAVISTFTGETYLKAISDRTKDPFDYWSTLIVQYLVGVVLMWWFWASAFPN
jgi:hypothetical protein